MSFDTPSPRAVHCFNPCIVCAIHMVDIWQQEIVNMMLTGPQPAGAWVLNFLGSAREVLSEQDASLINSALTSTKKGRDLLWGSLGEEWGGIGGV